MASGGGRGTKGRGRAAAGAAAGCRRGLPGAARTPGRFPCHGRCLREQRNASALCRNGPLGPRSSRFGRWSGPDLQFPSVSCGSLLLEEGAGEPGAGRALWDAGGKGAGSVARCRTGPARGRSACSCVCTSVASLPSPAVIVAAKPVTVSVRCSGRAGRTCGDVREETGLHYSMPKS